MVIPIFMLILSGILDFGFALYNRMTVINAAREGARVAAMVSDPSKIETAATDAAKSAAAQAGLTLSGVGVTCSDKTGTIVCSDAVTGDFVSVKANYSYHTFFPLAFGTAFDLSSTVEMVLDSIGAT